DIDLYRFTAVAGEAVTIGIAKTGGDASFTPYWRLLDADGIAVSGCNAYYANVVDCGLTAAGTYRVAVSDRSYAAMGSYDLMLTRRSAPCEDTSLPCDTATAGTIGHKLDIDLYTFTAVDGEVVNIAIAKTGTD